MFKLTQIILFLSLMAPGLYAQEDPNVRREAIQLLERANAVSTPPSMPDARRVESFRVLDATGGPSDGKFTFTKVAGLGTREDVAFGDFNTIDIWTRAGLATNRKSEVLPGDVSTVRQVTPIYLVHFGDEDVIHAIVNKGGENGQAMRCVEFETIRGVKRENNEFCFDAANGTLRTLKIADEEVDNSGFFPFAGALMPAKIVYWNGGVRRLEISQTFEELKAASSADLFVPPADAAMRPFCKTARRPIPVSMPQPAPGSGGRDIDVQIHAIVGRDGKVHEAVVQNAEREDLGAEALGLVRQWTFTPPMCNGEPNSVETTFVVHFHGR